MHPERLMKSLEQLNNQARRVFMVRITGDIHGDARRIVNHCKRFELSEDDTIIILGDAGYNFYNDRNEAYSRDRYQKAYTKTVQPTIFCIHGNHEIRPHQIESYKTKKWNGGIVWYEEEFPNILFAKDGEIYTIEGKNYLVIGGAYSVDKYYRTYRYLQSHESEHHDEFMTLAPIVYNHPVTKERLLEADEICLKYQYESYWWADEQPSEEIKAFVEEQITKHSDKDIYGILSHTCPYQYTPTEAFLPGLNQDIVDNSTEHWLEDISKKAKFSVWYCGHWHINKKIDYMHFLFDEFEEI